MFFKTYGKKTVAAILGASLILSVAACGNEDSGEDTSSESSLFEPITGVTENTDKTDNSGDADTTAETEEAASSDEPYVLPEGMYISELTGEPISEELKDQRPIAAMVDNELTALPHYGTSEADVVYELMNSTKNDRITRLMCIVKDTSHQHSSCS